MSMANYFDKLPQLDDEGLLVEPEQNETGEDSGSAGKSIRILVAIEPGLSSDIQVLSSQLLQPELGLELAGYTWESSLVYADAVEKEADVVLLSPNLQGYDPEMVQRLYHHPERPIITVALVSKGGDWARTMEMAGAVGHVYTPLDTSIVRQLASTIPPALRDAYSYRTSDKYVPQLAPTTAKIIDRGGWQRQVVAFWSPSGGVGKTTLSANLATSMGVMAGRNTLLIDADMNKGDAHILFDMAHNRPNNIYALAARYDGLARQAAGAVNRPDLPPPLLASHITPYRNSKLHILRGIPYTHMAASDFLGDYGALEFMHALFDTAAATYDFVVVDCGQSYNHPVHLVTLERAQAIYLVINSTVTSLFQARQVLQWATKKSRTDVGDQNFRIYLDLDRVKVVVNKYDDRHGIPRKEIQSALGLPVFREIPVAEDEEVTIALNAREPLVLFDRKSLVSQGILGLGETFYPPLGDSLRLGLGAKGRRKGLLDRVLGTPD
jgi:pilus assembly protein CpaE